MASAAIGAATACAAPAFGIERYELAALEENGSADTQAGSNPYELKVEAVLDESSSATNEDRLKNLSFELPPGLIVDPRATPYGDPVGEMQFDIDGEWKSSPLYNIAPEMGELGDFEFQIDNARMLAGVAFRAGIDHGTAAGDAMTMSITGLPMLLNPESIKLILGGTPPLLTLPTSCAGASVSTMQAESWGKQTASLSASLPELTGCDALQFQPTLSVVPEVVKADEPSGYSLRLTVPETARPPVASQLESASLTLPAGMSLSLSATNGLSGCGEAQFAPQSGEYGMCPQSSKVGQVALHTPLLARPLEGFVFLATQNGNPLGAPVALYVEAEDQASGTRIKLIGEMALNPGTGQPTLIFKNLPQFSIGEIELRLFGGARSLLANPPACGLATTVAKLAPWSGEAEAEVSSSFDVTEAATDGPCVTPAPFTPQLRIEPTTVAAGTPGTLVLSVSRNIGEQGLSRFSVQLPAGMTWMFGDVTPCGEPAAGEGACPSSAQIGAAILRVGPMSELAWFTGEVYLTEGYGGGQYGLSMAFDAAAGPLDLGEVVVRAAVSPNPSTGGLTIASDPLPQIVDGVPLQTRAVEIEIERPGFIVEPVACGSQQIGAAIDGGEGASVEVADPFDVEGCQAQAPAPAASHQGGQGGAPVHRAKSPTRHVCRRYPVRAHGHHDRRDSRDLPRRPARCSDARHARHRRQGRRAARHRRGPRRAHP